MMSVETMACILKVLARWTKYWCTLHDIYFIIFIFFDIQACILHDSFFNQIWTILWPNWAQIHVI